MHLRMYLCPLTPFTPPKSSPEPCATLMETTRVVIGGLIKSPGVAVDAGCALTFQASLTVTIPTRFSGTRAFLSSVPLF